MKVVVGTQSQQQNTSRARWVREKVDGRNRSDKTRSMATFHNKVHDMKKFEDVDNDQGVTRLSFFILHNGLGCDIKAYQEIFMELPRGRGIRLIIKIIRARYEKQ